MDANLPWKLAPFATGALGYIGGILSEPIKASLRLRQEKATLRRSLYSEMMCNLDVIERAVKRADGDLSYFSTYNPYPEQLRFGCYRHATSSQPVTFNLLRESQVISEVYAVLLSFVEKARFPENLLAYSEDTHAALLNVILDRRLDPFVLRKVSDRGTFGQPMWYRVWRSASKPFRRGDPRFFERPKRIALDSLISKKEAEIASLKRDLIEKAARQVAARKETGPPPPPR